MVLLAVIGWGKFITRNADDSLAGYEDETAKMLCGLYLLTLLGQVAPLFGPIAYITGLFFVVSGVILFAWLSYTTRSWRGWIAAGVTVPLVLSFCLASSRHIQITYDAGLYHLQFIRWMSETGTVVGLGNIHTRLGFNSTWFTTAALFTKAPDWTHGPFFWSIAGTTLLYFGLMVRGAWALTKKLRVCACFCWLSTALVGVTPPWGVPWLMEMTSSDIPAMLLILHAFASALALLEGRQHKQGSGEILQIMAMVASIVLAITTKLSSAPVLVLLICVVSRGVKQRGRQSLIAMPRNGTVAVILIALPTVWVLQNVLLSGCIVYPVAISCIDLPWSVGAAAAKHDQAWIGSWARIPMKDPNDPIFVAYGWLGEWAARNREWLREWAALLAIALVSAAAMRITRLGRMACHIVALPLAVAALGAATWFFSAPDTRFGAGFAVGFVALALTASLGKMPLLIPIGLTVGILVYSGTLRFITQMYTTSGTHILDGITLPQPDPVSRVTASGVRIFVPTPQDPLCWIEPTPCTPYFDNAITRYSFGPFEGFTSGKRRCVADGPDVPLHLRPAARGHDPDGMKKVSVVR